MRWSFLTRLPVLRGSGRKQARCIGERDSAELVRDEDVKPLSPAFQAGGNPRSHQRRDRLEGLAHQFDGAACSDNNLVEH
jgi:hypothetical protein